MRCREVGPLIADWVAGRLEPGVAPRVQEHLAACDSCRREAAAESRMRTLMRALPSEPLARDLTPAVLARIADAGKPVRLAWFRRAPAVAFAAGVFCALALLVKAPQVRVQPPIAVAAVDEGRVVRMVADMQELPDPVGESAVMVPASSSALYGLSSDGDR